MSFLPIFIYHVSRFFPSKPLTLYIVSSILIIYRKVCVIVMPSIVPLIDRAGRREKILGEINIGTFNTYRIGSRVLEGRITKNNCKVKRSGFSEEGCQKKSVPGFVLVFFCINTDFSVNVKKPLNMVTLLAKETPQKIPLSSFKTHVLEPVFVAPNIDEVKLKRTIHMQTHLCYLKSLYNKNKQNTLSNWNVHLNKRIEPGQKKTSGRYMIESNTNNLQNEGDISRVMLNLYNNVTQEIFDTVNVCKDISYSTL